MVLSVNDCITAYQAMISKTAIVLCYCKKAKVREPHVESRQSADSQRGHRRVITLHLFDLQATMQSNLLRNSPCQASALTGAAAVTLWRFCLCAVVPHLSLVWPLLISGSLVFTGVESLRGCRSCKNPQCSACSMWSHADATLAYHVCSICLNS